MSTSEQRNEQSELKIRLQELQSQLVKSSQISAADRDLLGKMVVGILQLEDVQQPQAETVTEQGLRDTLERKSLEYEAQHPKLAFTLRQILDVLARMGI
ncbi:MAG: DUF4404 family protein [Porticoccaceae bacterium]|jgi:hypothetical protein|nr:DUF4404 family protein [Porticoccaceae bacterium]